MIDAAVAAGADTAEVDVGIIGVGAMGMPMSLNLQRRGVAARVRDIDPAACQAARSMALITCDSAAALAEQCDIIMIVVVDAAQIERVLFGDAGENGVIHARRAAGASRQTVVLCSTIAPDDTGRFAARLLDHGIDTIDAPISGGPARAAQGEMSMMVAADSAVLARCEPLLRKMASRIFVVSERVGDAARAKLVNNLLAGVNLVAGAQALALGTHLGLDPRVLFDIINASSGASWMFADRMARALDGDFAPRARARILTKDVGLAVQMARDAGVATPMGEHALAIYRAAIEAGMGDADDASVIKVVQPSSRAMPER